MGLSKIWKLNNCHLLCLKLFTVHVSCILVTYFGNSLIFFRLSDLLIYFREVSCEFCIMKIKRQKDSKRVIGQYRHFGCLDRSPPYDVLIDGTFCKAALVNKINIGEQLPKYLACEVNLMTTRCAMAECEALGTLLYGPLKILRQYKVAKCHHNKPLSPTACFLQTTEKRARQVKNHLNNKESSDMPQFASKKHTFSNYVVCTQDRGLTEKITNERPGCPLMYISHNAIHFEAPTKEIMEANFSKRDAQVEEIQIVKEMKHKAFGPPKQDKIKHKKKAKGPNPLSCKKKSSKKTPKRLKMKPEKQEIVKPVS